MPADRSRVRVLFLCTGNYCRSQVAEGWARAIRADSLDPCLALSHYRRERDQILAFIEACPEALTCMEHPHEPIHQAR